MSKLSGTQEDMLYGADAADLLTRWDEGKPVFTVEMGGLGPGYEQALQIAMFEILRDLLDRNPDSSAWQDKEPWATEREIIETNAMPRVRELGLSGAQWGAAMSLAAALYMRGPRAAMKETPDDRHIQVCRAMPSAPPVSQP